MFYKTKDVLAMFNLLNDHKVEYILTKNIAGQFPSQLKIDKDIDIIVHPKDYEQFKALMLNSGYERVVHPHGKEVGWQFLYGAHENIFFRHVATSLIVDVYAELCTKSIAMNAWMPLDKSIQSSIWENKVWDEENRWWIMDDENMIVYLLTRSVFEKNNFSDAYISEIEKRKALLISPLVRQKLAKIFFKFTDTLLQKIHQRQYEDIVKAYITFTDY